MRDKKKKPIKTPCIGVCSTGIGDSVCRGCKRFEHEIIAWNSYSQAQKAAVIQRIEALLEQVVRSKVVIFNRETLETMLDYQRVRRVSPANRYCWVFDLLKAGAQQIDDLQAFGCRARGEWQGRSLTALRDAIDQDFYLLSTVHYERYFRVGEPQLQT